MNNQNQIDFSPITSSPHYLSDLAGANKNPTKTILFILGGTILLFTVVAIPFVAAALVFYIIKSNKKANERRLSIQLFAEKNGFKYEKQKSGFIKDSDRITSFGLDLPYKKVLRVDHMDKITGKLQGLDFSYNLSFVVRETKRDRDDKETQWPITIMIIDLPVQLPRMFINSKFNSMPGLEPKFDNFVAAEKHQLEGDFPNYYDVTIEKNEHIDMYVTLTPEVMDKLKQNNKYDVWLNGKQLVLMTFGDYTRYFAGTPQLFDTAQTLLHEIDAISRSMRRYETVSETVSSDTSLPLVSIHKA